MSYDLDSSATWDETFCSDDNPSISSISPGVPSSEICTYWDDIYRTMTFVPDQVTADVTCNDPLPTFMYSIDRTPLNGYEDSLKVSIDPRTSEISVKALSGRTEMISFTLTVTGTLPSRDTSTWTFVINLTTCALPSSPNIVASAMVDQIYHVTLPYADYDPPPFTVDPICP